MFFTYYLFILLLCLLAFVHFCFPLCVFAFVFAFVVCSINRAASFTGWPLELGCYKHCQHEFQVCLIFVLIYFAFDFSFVSF